MRPDGHSLFSYLCDVAKSADMPSRFNETLENISVMNKMLCLGNYPHFVSKILFLLNLLYVKVFRLSLFLTKTLEGVL